MKTLALLLTTAVALEGVASKKYIFAGWEFGDTTPEEVLLMADAFDRTACDGVALPIGGALPGCDGRSRRHVMNDPGWKYEDIAFLEPILRAIVEHPSLRESLLSVTLAPTNRLSWSDDRAWTAVAGSMGTLARLAKRGGLKGFVTDFEDYWRKKQYYFLFEQDGDYRQTLKLARQRGREVFGAVFREFPEAVILSYQLFVLNLGCVRSDDPVGVMVDRESLWPAYLNGVLDVLPPTAKLVDGNEEEGYHARADRGDFYRAVKDELVGVMPLVASENRAKYRAQVSAGFGLYMDSYSAPTNSGYYMEPKRGKRINHFEDNLRQATECADEYVWFWGEKGFYVDWPADLKERCGNTWRSSGGATWRGKYFGGSRSMCVVRPWRETLDGDFDLMARGVKEPLRCVREQYAKQKADGSLVNLLTQPVKPDEQGGVNVRIEGLETDGWYGVRASGRGRIVRGNAYFQHKRSWRWNLGSFRMSFERGGADVWREGWMLVRMPEGATDIFLCFGPKHGDKEMKVAFKDIEVFRIR